MAICYWRYQSLCFLVVVFCVLELIQSNMARTESKMSRERRDVGSPSIILI